MERSLRAWARGERKCAQDGEGFDDPIGNKWNEWGSIDWCEALSMYDDLSWVCDDESLYEDMQERAEREFLRVYAYQRAERTSLRYRRQSLPAWALLSDWWQEPADEVRLKLGFGQRKRKSNGRKKHSKKRRPVESVLRGYDPAADEDFVLPCECAPEDRCDCPA